MMVVRESTAGRRQACQGQIRTNGRKRKQRGNEERCTGCVRGARGSTDQGEARVTKLCSKSTVSARCDASNMKREGCRKGHFCISVDGQTVCGSVRRGLIKQQRRWFQCPCERCSRSAMSADPTWMQQQMESLWQCDWLENACRLKRDRDLQKRCLVSSKI